MKDKIKKIVDNFEKTEKNYRVSKNKIMNWAEEIGYQEKLASNMKNLFKEYQEYDDLPHDIIDPIYSLSKDLCIQSTDLNQEINDSKYVQSK